MPSDDETDGYDSDIAEGHQSVQRQDEVSEPGAKIVLWLGPDHKKFGPVMVCYDSYAEVNLIDKAFLEQVRSAVPV